MFNFNYSEIMFVNCNFERFFSAILGKESSDDYIKMDNESRPPDLRGLENNIVELDIEDSPEHP